MRSTALTHLSSRAGMVVGVLRSRSQRHYCLLLLGVTDRSFARNWRINRRDTLVMCSWIRHSGAEIFTHALSENPPPTRRALEIGS